MSTHGEMLATSGSDDVMEPLEKMDGQGLESHGSGGDDAKMQRIIADTFLVKHPLTGVFNTGRYSGNETALDGSKKVFAAIRTLSGEQIIPVRLEDIRCIGKVEKVEL